MKPLPLILDRIASPLGEILYVGDRNQCTYALDFSDCAERMHRLLARYAPGGTLANGELPWARAALQAYFAGDPAALASSALHNGGSVLQNAVWRELRRIPSGATRSYSEVALAVGKPRAVRAVASANARNPVAIIVPCHRVIGRDGGLAGYAGGLWRKEWLLRHEGGWALRK